MTIAYKIADVRAVLDYMEAAGAEFVSPVVNGFELTFVDWNSSPIIACGVRHYDAPLDKSGRLDLQPK